MALSKPIMNLLASYLQNLYLHPIKTKAITSCLVGTAGSIAAQLASGSGVDVDQVVSFGSYGLLFGGTIPHYIYEALDRMFPEEVVAFPLAKKLLFERLIIAPIMQAFSLYTLARLEGRTHIAAWKQLIELYSSILKVNWKWMTIFQIINLSFIPPMLRVLFMNLVGFGWTIFVATAKKQQAQRKGQGKAK